ncbi:MAG: D-alanyl-D-alanine carboxypeptidase [Alphaproteobacteria bacterium]|nr:MAG: D-alanyl-D-alanine carboxypeptidase [Alphaproteobacteria bacterium]
MVRGRPRRRRLPQGMILALFLWALTPLAAAAAPFAALVMDARDGRVLYARNADTRLHPASLTKMMTLYIAFEAIRNGEITLDTPVRISRRAASEPPSRLGLRAGQRIKLRYLIRAAAVKSANDAATAIAEAISGSVPAFARRMNRTARALGMTRTTFRNANGLTERGHLSTARDMTILGRHLFFDFPEYYNLFSRRSTYAGIRTVANTNRRFLNSYPGADGIKTGYTAAAGFNLVASARRGEKRIIATVFGGRSAAARNRKVAELLDLGFRRAPAHVAVIPPEPPRYDDRPKLLTASLVPPPRPGAAELPPVPEKAIESALIAALAERSGRRPLPRPEPIAREEPSGEAPRVAAAAEDGAAEDGPVVVTRASTSGPKAWAVVLGRFPTRIDAEKRLVTAAVMEADWIDGSLRKVRRTGKGWEARFTQMSADQARIACARLRARGTACETVRLR